MPYKIRKLPNKNKFRLYNTETGKIYAKGTTLENAQKQMKLLNAIDHGFKPKRRRSSLRK